MQYPQAACLHMCCFQRISITAPTNCSKEKLNAFYLLIYSCFRAVWSLGSTAYCLAFGFSPNESFRGEDGRLRIAEPSQLRALGTVMFPTASDRLPVRIRDAASSAALPSAATAPPAAVSASGHPFSSDFCALLTAMMSTDDAARPSVGEVAVRAAALLRHGVR